MANKLSQPTVPYSEAPWIQGLPSSIFTDPSHIRLREWARKWVEDVLFPATAKYEAADRVTDNEAYARAAKDGLLLPFGVGVKIPQKLVDLAGGIQLPAGIKASEWNNIHDYILWDEFNRVASAGAVMGLFGGLSYGAGPIIHFASEEQQKRWLPEIFTGKKRICLAITEPLAGSNVANLSTSATLSECGKYYIVNGGKKWITNGVYSDYFTTAVRTSGKPGDPTGVTLLVIPRGEGVTTKSMKMMGGGGSGTTLVEFDDVKVPVENRIGKEGEGLRFIFYNFNHERLTIAFVALRYSRVCLEDAIAHAIRREVFGKKLIEQPVVRHKIGHMAREVEALQAWVESVVFSQSKLTTEQSNVLTGGTCALLKAHAGIVLEKVCREAVHILGGMGLTKGGTGERIERIYRETKALTVPGGSEDVLIDLGVRQQLKLFKSGGGANKSKM